MAVGIVATAIVFDIRLLAGPAVKLADGDGEQFALLGSVDRNRQLAADFTQLRLAEANLGLGDAAIAIADAHIRIGRRQSGPDEQQHTQAKARHQA